MNYTSKYNRSQLRVDHPSLNQVTPHIESRRISNRPKAFRSKQELPYDQRSAFSA